MVGSEASEGVVLSPDQQPLCNAFVVVLRQFDSGPLLDLEQEIVSTDLRVDELHDFFDLEGIVAEQAQGVLLVQWQAHEVVRVLPNGAIHQGASLIDDASVSQEDRCLLLANREVGLS